MIVATVLLALIIAVFLVQFFAGKHIEILAPQDITMVMELNNVASARDVKSFLVVTIPFVETSRKYPGRPQVVPIFEELEVELKDQLNAVFSEFTIIFLIDSAMECFINCPGRDPMKAFLKLAPQKLSEAARKLTSAEMSSNPQGFKIQLLADIRDLCKSWGVKVTDVNFVYHSPEVLDKAASIRTTAEAQAYASQKASIQEVENYQREFRAEGFSAWLVNNVGEWFVQAAKHGAFQFFGLGADAELVTKIQALIKQQGGANDAR